MEENSETPETEEEDITIPEKPIAESPKSKIPMERKTSSPFGESLGMPAKFTIKDFLRSLQILAEKSGSAQIKELKPLFGEKKSELLTRSLKFAEDIGYTNKQGYRYTLTSEGKEFLGKGDIGRKKELKSRLQQYEKYKDLFIALRNAENQTLKKEEINNKLISLVGGGSKIRGYMTRTFASLCDWAEIIKDSGKICKLVSDDPSPVEDSKKVKETTGPKMPEGDNQNLEEVQCPRCLDKDVGLINEEAVKFIDAKEKTVVIKQLQYLCKKCQNNFTRVRQETINHN